MATPSTIAAKWREAKTILSGMASKADQFSDFDGLVQRVSAPEGYFKLTDWVIPGKFNDRTGTANVRGVSSFYREFSTKPRDYHLQIDKDLMERVDAIANGELSRMARAIGKTMMADRDERLSQILTDNSGSGATDITGNNFFGSIQWPDTTTTVSNVVSGAGSTAANIQTDFWKAIAAFRAMSATTGYRLHGSRADADRSYILMYPAALEEAMQNAFAAQNLASGATNVAFNKVSLRCNPSLDATSTADWYLFLVDEAFPIFIEGVAGELQFAETQMNDSYVILNKKYLMNVEYKTGYAPGSRAHAIKVNN